MMSAEVQNGCVFELGENLCPAGGRWQVGLQNVEVWRCHQGVEVNDLAGLGLDWREIVCGFRSGRRDWHNGRAGR